MLAFAPALLRGTAKLQRSIKVVLPRYKEHTSDLPSEELVKRIYSKVNAFASRAVHLLRRPAVETMHKTMEIEALEVCSVLSRLMIRHHRATDAKVVGALAHCLSYIQDTIWDSSLLPNQYRPLIEHLWLNAHQKAKSMSATDVSSTLYACYTFRDFLLMRSRKKPSMQPTATVTKGHASGKLVDQLCRQYETVAEMGTGQDALSVLLGLAAAGKRNDPFIPTIISTYILPQIPVADHEILGLIAWSLGQLKPQNANEVMDEVVKRFDSLKNVEYATLQIETIANLLCGLAEVDHDAGKKLASKLIQYIDRARDMDWRPRCIVRMAWGVARLDAHTPTFTGKILREAMKSGHFFTPIEVRLFQKAIDEMNVEPTDELWKRMAQRPEDTKAS